MAMNWFLVQVRVRVMVRGRSWIRVRVWFGLVWLSISVCFWSNCCRSKLYKNRFWL